jgi:predicted nucleotidyltransferase
LSHTPLPETLEEIVRRISAALAPEQIVLFGSHAWGEPTADSDIDLLVVVPESDEPPHSRAVRAHRALRGLPVPCDILVRTRTELERVNPVRSSLLYRAMTEGRRIDRSVGYAVRTLRATGC